MPERIYIKYAGPTPIKVEATAITAGSVEIATACFEFDSTWDGFTKTAVFKSDEHRIAVPLNNSNECIIPWEVLTKPGLFSVGVFGTLDIKTLPSEETTFMIREGVAGEGTSPKAPTPSIYEILRTALTDLAARIENLEEKGGNNGADGATYYPSVDTDGNLSWTNNKNLPNPDSVNIKGYSPVRGVDYWTDEDKAEIKEYVDEKLGDVEGALDAVIEIQNSLIGGASV